MERGQRSEVAAVDGAPVPASSRREDLPGVDGERPVCHERGGLPPALTAVRGHAARALRHMEVK